VIIEAYLVKGIKNHELRRGTMNGYYDQAKIADSAKTADALRASGVADHFQWIGRNAQDMTSYLIKKIEMSHRFVQAAPK
jgi:hypothetical protein